MLAVNTHRLLYNKLQLLGFTKLAVQPFHPGSLANFEVRNNHYIHLVNPADHMISPVLCIPFL